jgi:hypothetical protein
MPTKKAPKTERQRIQTHIKRLWGDCEVIDAKKDLRVMILPDDVKGAKRKDPAECVFARACMRSFRSKKMLFYRSTAYVELPDKNGKKRVERFIMDASMRSLVAAFDRGDTVIPEAGFVLKAPSPNRRLDAQLKARRQSTERRRLLNGELLYPKRPETRHGVAGTIHVRSGTGAVHFSVKEKPDA